MGSKLYPRFARLDGRHALKRLAPDGHVSYSARRVRGGEVVWFNFDLARQMGLIPHAHPPRLNRSLRAAILDAFGLRIINEYDLEKRTRVSARDRMAGTYMATRYLQLQHPGRTGRTSGDGRSVWNGSVSHRGKTWDVSSCGTGVTRLCPATAEHGRFFRTGNDTASYGCGTATLAEGLSAALMSQAFHRSRIATERVLAVIRLPDGYAINVRAAPNLLRPSHFFMHLKQNNLAGLRSLVDHHIERQQANGVFPVLRGRRRYEYLATETARIFGQLAATFESEYIFCWLDWDGDNILVDGGIIDYGSVRQFGLYHRQYCFDDGPRWSTTLEQQRRKSRHLVQCFAQIRDFLINGSRSPLSDFTRDPCLALFDSEFRQTRHRLLLRNVGFDEQVQDFLLAHAIPEVERFRRIHRWFERAQSARGPVKVGDGLNWNAIYSTRDLLRELPGRLLGQDTPPSPREVLQIATSSYASRRDRIVTPWRQRQAREFLSAYTDLLDRAALVTQRAVPLLLQQMAPRTAVLNRFDRLTGDAALYATRRLLRARRKISSHDFHRVIAAFLDSQAGAPETLHLTPGASFRNTSAKNTLDALLGLAAELRYGL